VAECEQDSSLPHTPQMRTSISVYRRHRFPAEIISHSVWLYFRFALSFRDVEEMLAMRGVPSVMRLFENIVLPSEVKLTYRGGLVHLRQFEPGPSFKTR
jgi:hypothetical protein